MPDFDHLTTHLHQWNRRRLVQEALVWVPRGLLAGLLLAVIVAAVARSRPLLTNEEVGYVALGLGLLGLLGTALFLLLQRRSLLEQARFADRTFGLKERASTAVEIHEGRIEVAEPLARKQFEDTLRVAAAVDVARALPLKADRRDWLVLLLALGLLLAAVWLPNPQVEILQAQRELARTIAEEATALEELIQEIEENPELGPEEQEALLEPLQAALEELQQGDLTQEEAVAVLSEAEAELRDLSASFDNEALRRQLESAGQPLTQNAAGQNLGQSLQSGNLSQASAAAASLADSLPTLDSQSQQSLAQSLAQAAEALAQTDPELAQELAEAAAALENGDTAAAQQALQEAAGTLQQRAQQQAAAAQAAAAAGQVNQGRGEIAQSGQGSGQAQGQGGQSGQGSGQGQGQGSGQGEGQGSGQGQGAGQGSGQGSGSGGDSGTGAGGGVGGSGGETGHTDNVYVPDFADLSGEPGEDVQLPAECLADPSSCGPLVSESPTEFGEERSLVPYSEVFGDYRDAAYQALEEEPIPLGLKGYIRDYFSSLEP